MPADEEPKPKIAPIKKASDSRLREAQPPGSFREQGSDLGLNDPVPWPEPVNGRSLVEAIVLAIRRHVAVSMASVIAIALWVLHTYVIDAAVVSPILALISPEKRCGKTTLLGILGRLVRRPLPTSNISTAALFRVIEGAAPTLLIDEADSFFDDRNELRGILNSGHSRSMAYVIRCTGDEDVPKRFSTWGAKVIARIGRLTSTLEDRSIVIPMRRRLPEEQIDRLRSDTEKLIDHLASQAHRWGRDNVERLRDADPSMPSELHDRAADGWRPLLAIAELIGGDLPVRAAAAAVELSADQYGASAGEGELLLADLRDVFASASAVRLQSTDLLVALAAMEERPWASELNRGRQMTPSQLARILRRFDIVPRAIRFGQIVRRGYELDDMQEAFARYLPPETQQSQQASQAAKARDVHGRNRAEKVTASKSGRRPRPARGVSDVAARGRPSTVATNPGEDSNVEPN